MSSRNTPRSFSTSTSLSPATPEVLLARKSNVATWNGSISGSEGSHGLRVSGGGTLVAYDAAAGKELAVLEGLVGNTIPSPAAWDEYVVVGAGENRMKPDQAASARSN